MKIFLVTEGMYSDYVVRAAFTTRDAAERYMDAYGFAALVAANPDAPVLDYRGAWTHERKLPVGIDEIDLDPEGSGMEWLLVPYGEHCHSIERKPDDPEAFILRKDLPEEREG